MSQVYDMYRMVRIVRKEARRMDKLEPQSIKDTGFDVWHPATSSVKMRFIKYRPWIIPTDSAHTVGDCIEAKYLRGETLKDTFGNELDVLCVLKKGRKLVERTWLIFPTGLWQVWQEENGKAFFAFMSGIITLLTGIVLLLGKIAFFG